ncbi:MBL fold metallo-hydrolase [Novosphingobium sp. 9]|uniref:MBL fold metallo-hydrolase n=1 Tax=Novosphingobium sp. 9 TaxID=2025349 RepID=UPI0021B6A6B1|nr:MBL fold metallo-hydrolase [Novosphingobium sp. 9]
MSATALAAPSQLEAQAQAPVAHAPSSGLSITLLGTAGGPPPHADRSQPATLLQIDGTSYLIDAGENVGQQLKRAGSAPQAVTTTFITHLHWDHTLGLGYLMATGWMMGRNAPMAIWGPPGTSEYVTRETAALKIGEDIFHDQTPNRPALASLYPAHDVDVGTPREIYRDAHVTVSAVANTHYGTLKTATRDYGPQKSYAYRFDTAKGSVTFTGDTGPSPAVANLAKNSDVLVSEVCDVDGIRATLLETMPADKIGPLMEHMEHEHLTPTEVGKLAQAAGVHEVVLTHFVVGKSFDAKRMIAEIRQAYPVGRIVLGKDLQTIAVTK